MDEIINKDQFSNCRDSNGQYIPPFQVFPEYAPTSMGWRMGAGESYITLWLKEQSQLGKLEKKEYRKKYPAPLYWFTFYWNFHNEEKEWLLFPLIILTIISWPLTIPLHNYYKKNIAKQPKKI